MITKRTLLGLVVFALVLSFGAKSYAQTPDEMTPAEETICDGEVGAAYGLCNAYCEAMDCDSPEPMASDRACERVLASYMKITDGGMPPCLDACLNVECERGLVCIDGECCIPPLQQCKILPAGSICDAQTCSQEGYICTEDGECCTEPGPPICLEP